MTIWLRSTLTLGLLACGTSDKSVALDSQTEDTGMSADAAPVGLPNWMLEDVQPTSPRVGQTYGLQTFSGKIVVVTLLEGF